MSAIRWVYGKDLSPTLRKQLLEAYVHRLTVENRPRWAKDQVATMTDAQWLDATTFAVTKSGRLDERVKRCNGGWPT